MPTVSPKSAASSSDSELHRPMPAETQHRLAGLYADLAQVHDDRVWAIDCQAHPLPAWLAGIAAEERDRWEHIVETVTGH